MKDMIKTGLLLFIVSALAGLLLAQTEAVTAPIIKANEQKKIEAARRAILPGSESFAEFEVFYSNATFSCALARDKASNPLGYAIEAAPKGYGGAINMQIGVSLKGEVKGVSILSLSETPGLGQKLKSDDFMNKFNCLIASNSSPCFCVKKDGGDIDAVTGATISSRAFCQGIKDALSVYKTIDFNKIKALSSVSQTSNSNSAGAAN